MDFDYSEEQTALQDALRRFAGNHYTFAHRESLLRERRWCRDAWATYAELGLLALPFSAEIGGLEGSAFDVLAAMEVFGEHLMLEPFVPTTLLAGGVLAQASSAQHRDLVAAVMAGRATYALAHQEPHLRHTADRVDSRAQRVADGWRLDGRKALVLGAPGADGVVVSARLSDAADAAWGLFLVVPGQLGLRQENYRLYDGQLAADLWLDGLHLPEAARLGTVSPARDVVLQALDRAVAALCAGAVGSMQALVRQTIGYLQQRKQFGQPLSQFQALRHRVAEMSVQVEQARSMTLLATAHVDGGDAALRGRMVSGAKALVALLARQVGQSAVQLHGGMGLTEELMVGHHFRYLTVFESLLGDADHHLMRFATSKAHEEWEHAA